jgi:hypothetical protein
VCPTGDEAATAACQRGDKDEVRGGGLIALLMSMNAQLAAGPSVVEAEFPEVQFSAPDHVPPVDGFQTPKKAPVNSTTVSNLFPQYLSLLIHAINASIYCSPVKMCCFVSM